MAALRVESLEDSVHFSARKPTSEEKKKTGTVSSQFFLTLWLKDSFKNFGQKKPP